VSSLCQTTEDIGKLHGPGAIWSGEIWLTYKPDCAPAVLPDVAIQMLLPGSKEKSN